MSEWQPIETAPKDAEILVTGVKTNGDRYRETTKWFKSKKHGNGGFFPVIWMDGYGEPDFWHPLPSPPATPSDAEMEAAGRGGIK